MQEEASAGHGGIDSKASGDSSVSNTVWIFINGINNWPGSSAAWTDRAVTWTHQHTEHRAEKLEYWAGAVSRRWFGGNTKRATALLDITGTYRKWGWAVNWVGHSNGAEVINIGLRLVPELASATLIAPACEADCEKNGMNAALYDGRLKRLAVHWGDRDRAMVWAKASKILAGWAGLGYGNMGSKGPQNISPSIEHLVATREWGDYGHSTFFDRDKFEETMQAVVLT